MVLLHELARQFQQEIDNIGQKLSTPTADTAGMVLVNAMMEATASAADRNEGFSALQPIILRTTLAASIVQYFERLPWAEELTLIKVALKGDPSTAFQKCIVILMFLFKAVDFRSLSSDARRRDGASTALLLKQVRHMFLF